MLDAWIIEEIEKQRREREDSQRLPLELPIYEDPPMPMGEVSPADSDRGVIIIDI
jgi:hypothetical protein